MSTIKAPDHEKSDGGGGKHTGNRPENILASQPLSQLTPPQLLF